ncbi:MAG: DUF1801 domain-containing protein [Armatimonadota bacterium]
MATTPEEFLAGLPADRIEAVTKLREVIKQNLQPGFEEGMQYGGIGFFVPHSVFPAGYHCDPKQPLPFLTLTNTKGHIALHAFVLYCLPVEKERFIESHNAAGKKLDMGAGCIRYKKHDAIAYEAIGEMVSRIQCEEFVRRYQSMVPDKKKKK